MVRLFSLEEANRLLPAIDECLARAKKVLDEMRDLRDQLTDLRIIWGERIESEECPDYAEYKSFRSRFVKKEAELSRILGEVSERGVEVKDPDLGLVDFQTPRGEEIVYLCWMRGEPSIQHWHTLNGGFSARQPLSTF